MLKFLPEDQLPMLHSSSLGGPGVGVCVSRRCSYSTVPSLTVARAGSSGAVAPRRRGDVHVPRLETLSSSGCVPALLHLLVMGVA